jgi:hypothetical protein
MPRCLECSTENCGYRKPPCTCECHGTNPPRLWTNLVAMLMDIQKHVKETGDKVMAADSPGSHWGYYSEKGHTWRISPTDAMYGLERLNELVARDLFKSVAGRQTLTKLLNGEPLDLFKPLDADVPEMSLDQLKAEVMKLREGIRKHRDATGHNLCWYVPELWGLLPDKVQPKPEVPPRAEFLANCEKYRASLK